jgi:hypothetical protein
MVSPSTTGKEYRSGAQRAFVRDHQLVIEGITLRGTIVRRAVGVRIHRRILPRVLGLERQLKYTTGVEITAAPVRNVHFAPCSTATPADS